MPSTLEKLTEVASELTPKPAVHAVSSQAGGVLCAPLAASLPRNDRQVKDIRRKMKSVQSKDPLLSLMMMCKESMTDFVRTVTGAPDYMVVLSCDRTLNNLVRFCTNPMLPSVVSFDPTFSLGAFDVTVTTYKHPLLVFRNPQEHSSPHPNLLGPILIHQRKQFSNYQYFTSTLVGLRPSLRNLTAFGTDGEAALVQACSSQFPSAVHLRCWLHFKDNLRNKLERDLRLPRNVAQEFIADVLGVATTLERGLADAADEDAFAAQLISLREVWDERESQCTNEEPVFYQWFQVHCADTVRETMLRSVRQLAGLGLPPTPFYTNAVESINSLLKLRTDYKKQELTTFVIKLKELVEAQFAEVDRAIAGMGDYEVAKEYPNFQYSAARWCTMSEDQRKRVLQRFQSADPVAICADSQGESSSLPQGVPKNNDQSSTNPLTGLGIPHYIADMIWKSATALLQEDSNFVHAPGNVSQSWIVASSSGSTCRPRFVRVHQGHYECESDCTYFQTCKVCAHVVATAQRNGDLEKVTAWHKRQGHGIGTNWIAQGFHW